MLLGNFARVVVALLVVAIPSVTPSKECTRKEVEQADHRDAINASKNWTWLKLHESFRRFGHCIDPKNPGIWDAELATTYDGAVQYLLIDDWGRVADLGKLSERHPSFKTFVLSLINEDFPLDGAKVVIANARDNCPRSYKTLCKAIEAAAQPIPNPG
jgi:hypothetical protein